MSGSFSNVTGTMSMLLKPGHFLPGVKRKGLSLCNVRDTSFRSNSLKGLLRLLDFGLMFRLSSNFSQIFEIVSAAPVTLLIAF